MKLSELDDDGRRILERVAVAVAPVYAARGMSPEAAGAISADLAIAVIRRFAEVSLSEHEVKD